MLEKIKEMIAEQLNVDAAEITEATSFKDDLGADSLDLFELVMALEEEYGVEIPSEDLEKITTVGAVMDYLKSIGGLVTCANSCFQTLLFSLHLELCHCQMFLGAATLSTLYIGISGSPHEIEKVILQDTVG